MSEQTKTFSQTTGQDTPNAGRQIALIVGVDESPRSGNPPLKHAVADALAMAEVLKQHCHFELLEEPLLNEHATSSNIKRAILNLKRDRNDNDFLLFYFSGHGFPWSSKVEDDIYLVTSDLSPREVTDDPSLHLSFKWLYEKLYVENQAGKMILMLDCCYAGNMGLTAPDLYLEDLWRRLHYYFDAPGAASGAKIGSLRLTLAATSHNATATEKEGHGLMTSWMLSALRGKEDDAMDADGQVTLYTLRSFLQSKMPIDRSPSLSGGDAGRTCVLASFPEHRRKRILSQQLAIGMAPLPTDYTARIQNFFTEYLGTPERPVPFGGREADITRLNAWLDDSKVPPYLLLAAPAGRGKSALLVRWSQQLLGRTDLAVVFLPVSIRFRTNLAGVVFAALTTRLASLHHEKIHATADMPVEMWRDLLTNYLTRPLPDGRRLLLIIDGVDEAADWEVGPDLFPLAPPNGLRIILSARYVAGDVDEGLWLRRMGWDQAHLACPLPLNPLTPLGIAEALRSMGFPLDAVGARTDIVAELHRLSEGDPLLVRLYVDDFWKRGERAVRLRPEDLVTIHPGLQGYFSRWWEDQRRLWATEAPLREPSVQALLNLLACALGPLSQEVVLRLAPPEVGLTTWTLEGALLPLERFVIGDGRQQGYTFSHPRLGFYFYENLADTQRQTVESRFLSWGGETLAALNEGRLPPEQVSSYIVQYYGAHLERAKKGAEVLLPLVSDGWRRAWEGLEGSYAGFLNDTAKAWRAAQRENAAEIRAGHLGLYIGEEVHCVLCQASINSLAKNIPPVLLVKAVEKGIWTPTQGVALARQKPEPEQRAQALVRLVPHVQEASKMEILREVLGTARMIKDERERTQILKALTPFLSEGMVQETLEVVWETRAERDRIELLEAFAPILPETLLREVLENLKDREDEIDKVGLLAELAPFLSERLVQVALEASKAIETEKYQVWVLKALAPSLSESLLREALERARGMASVDNRAVALASLAPYLLEKLKGEGLREVLEAVRMIQDERDRKRMLFELLAFLPEGLLEEALTIIRAIKDEYDRAQVLTALASTLPEQLRGKALHEALEAARAIKFEYSRAQVLTALAPTLPETLLREALEAAQAIENEGYRAQVLTALAPALPEQLREKALREALEAARAIKDEDRRAQVLIGLALSLAKLPPIVMYSFWCELLHSWASGTRHAMLTDLSALFPVIFALGGAKGVVETCYAILEVGQWWA